MAPRGRPPKGANKAAIKSKKSRKSKQESVPLREALAKGKGGLTLAQLASYDDIITDALVDHVRRLSPIPQHTRPSEP